MIEAMQIGNNWDLEGFNMLVDPKNSLFPPMPETVESAVSVAGRDGEVPLNSTYGSRAFELVCYSEDGLSYDEMQKAINRIVLFLHKYKNKDFRLSIKPRKKSYFVRYIGAIEIEEYPMSFKLTIPLKSYESFGYVNVDSKITGNSNEKSYTVEPTGFICTIKGATNGTLKLKFNGVEMNYTGTLAANDKLIINSKINTITKIAANGTQTNEMARYNKEFPKVVNGKNTLQVVSGVAADNVTVEWTDLVF